MQPEGAATAIKVTGLRKAYGKTVALDGLDFEAAPGRITGFLGPNGAGKTTTFRALLGLTHPDAGHMTVLGMEVGKDTPALVKRLGAVVEEPGLIKGLSGRDNLRVAAYTLGRGWDRIGSMLELVGLAADGGRRIDGYSKGMRQRLALAAALLGDPDLLLLDEPLDGLDPAGQVQFKRLLRELAAHGKSVVVSSHDLADVEEMADDVVLINHGKLVTQGEMASLLAGGGFRVVVDDARRAVELLNGAGLTTRMEGSVLMVDAESGADISRVLGEAGLYPSEVAPRKGRLEDFFLQLTDGGIP
jgi:ABC-2 type transport system ATP-binding protein